MQLFKKLLSRGLALALVFALLIPMAVPSISVAAAGGPVLSDLPDVVAAEAGESVSIELNVKAYTGNTLTYQWFFAENGSDRFYASSITSDTYTVKMSEARNGRRIYCLVTDEKGRTTESEMVTLKLGTSLVIQKQPKDVTVSAGKSAITSVKASGEGKLQYQWYFKENGSNRFLKSSIVTDTYNVKMQPEVAGRQIYCVITDELGQQVTTSTVTLSMNDDLGIYAQPVDRMAKDGQTVYASVGVNGSGKLTYQWYVRKAGGKKFYASSVTGPVYSTKMSAAVDGRQVYCVITDEKGNSAVTDTVTLSLLNPITITKQPANTKAGNGTNASVSVQATGGGTLSYQWFFAQPGSDTFVASSITSDTYLVKMSSARNGRQVYCVISDNYGQSVTTQVVTLSLAKDLVITQQPTDAVALNKQTASTTVTATGDGTLTYQWFVKKPGGKQFYASSVTGTTYKTVMSDSVDGRQVYCVITDRYGQKVVTDTVVIRKPTSLVITSAPQDAKALMGSTVSTSVAVSGDGTLTYEWYICNAGGKKFYKSSINGPTYKTLMSDSVNGRRAYCVITDQYGQSITTDVVTLSTPQPLVISRQPEDVSILSGKIFEVSVEASGEGELQYQWYVRNVGRKKFYPSSAKGPTYSAEMSDSVNGREIYCVITDQYGQTVTTDTVTLSENTDGLHILIVGNSHSLDAFWFLRSAYLDQYPDADLCIGILYYSGGSISEHVTAANNKDPVNRYYLNNDGKWVIQHEVTHEYILSDQEWDIILMQPGKEDIVHPTLNKDGRYALVEVINRYVTNPHVFMWHITWPCPNDETFFSPDYIRQPPDGYKDRLIALYDFNPVNQYSEKIEMTKQHILDDPLYADSLCSGAAVMHALLTQGVSQLDLYRDYTHLNDYGRLMVAYALVAQFTKTPIETVGIDVIDVRSRYYMFKDQGDLTITDEMKQIIIQAANYSLESPWEMPEQTALED